MHMLLRLSIVIHQRQEAHRDMTAGGSLYRKDEDINSTKEVKGACTGTRGN